jgi:hypothetical protein
MYCKKAEVVLVAINDVDIFNAPLVNLCCFADLWLGGGVKNKSVTKIMSFFRCLYI